jgi:serine/threonine-protein kinase
MLEPPLGSVFAGYRIDVPLGRGGMGVVYLATQLALERQVALKLIAPEFAADAVFRERFARELRFVASIDHPNVIPVHHAGEEDGILFIAMRYVRGTDLRTMVLRSGGLEPIRAARIVDQVAQALDAAHAVGLLHRDVKPGNILIEERGGNDRVFLTDFGLSRSTTSGGGLTAPGQWVGTADYVSPEQILGQGLDHHSDIYSLGCVLYEALAGHPPFADKEGDPAKLWAHMHDPPPALPQAAGVTAALQEVIQRALAKHRDERYPSAGALGSAALDAVADEVRTRGGASTPSLEDPATRIAARPAPAPEASRPQPAPAARAGEGAGSGRREIPSDAGEAARAPSPSAPPRGAPPRSAPVTDPAGDSAPPAAGPPTHVPGREEREADQPVHAGTPRESPPRSRRGLLVAGAVVALLVIAGVAAAALGVLGGDSSGGDGSAAATIDVGSDPAHVVSDGEAVWVLNRADSTVARIDPGANEVTNTVAAGSRPIALAGGEGAVWAVDGGITRIDPGSRQSNTTSVSLPTDSYGIAAGGGLLWIANGLGNSVSAVNPGSMEVVRRQIPVGSTPSALTVSEGTVWVANSDSGTVSRIDVSTRQPVGEEIPVGRGPSAIAAGEGSIWVTNADSNDLTRIDARSGQVSGEPIRVGQGPAAVAVGAGAVWVANGDSNDVTRIDPQTNRATGTPIPVGTGPSGIAVAGGSVWVANAGSDSVTRIDP